MRVSLTLTKKQPKSEEEEEDLFFFLLFFFRRERRKDVSNDERGEKKIQHTSIATSLSFVCVYYKGVL